MNEDCPTLITIGTDTFEVGHGLLETLDEIGFVIGTNSRGEVLQQAVVMLYLLARERHEKRMQTFMHYPDGAMRMLKFWKTASRPALREVGGDSCSAPEAPQAPVPGFEHYRESMEDFRLKQEGQVHHLRAKKHASNDDHFA